MTPLFNCCPFLGRILRRVPPSSGVFSAGEAPRCQSGLSELRRAEPAAAAFSPAAADHADREHGSHLGTGGKSEPAAETGKLETVKTPGDTS